MTRDEIRPLQGRQATLLRTRGKEERGEMRGRGGLNTIEVREGFRLAAAATAVVIAVVIVAGGQDAVRAVALGRGCHGRRQVVQEDTAQLAVHAADTVVIVRRAIRSTHAKMSRGGCRTADTDVQVAFAVAS